MCCSPMLLSHDRSRQRCQRKHHESYTVAPIQQAKETTPMDLGSLLDAGDGAMVTLVAGDTRLAAHRAVLMERSPVFAAMFSHDMMEAGSGEVSIPDLEGPVLRQLLAFLYTLRAPQLLDLASDVLVVADKYGLSALKAACEQQVAAQLCVETAAAAAVLAVRHSCEDLRKTAINFVKANLDQVMRTQGWADAVHMHPEDVVEVSRLIGDPPAETRPIQQTKETAPMDLGSLLDAGDGAVVTLVAGDTRLVAHRAVLVERSPVFAAMFGHDTLEAGSGEVSIPDVEGPVLRQLLAFLYTLQAPQLSDMASPLLVAADKYGVSALKAACEQQVAAQLSVETAAAAAVLAVRHSCESLRKTAINFIKAHTYQVMASQGWADAVSMHSDDMVKVSRVLADLPAESRPIQQTKETAPVNLGSLLDAGNGAVVTLVAGDTRLVAHRAVLVERIPVFAAMFDHDMLEAGSGEVSIPDVEGPVLRQLLAFLYTLRAPQLLHLASDVLVVADKYSVSALKAACEQQVAAQLCVETAATAAVLAVRHSCEDLRKIAINFVKANLEQVMRTQGWADAVRLQPQDVVEVSRLVGDPPAETRPIQQTKVTAPVDLGSLLDAGDGAVVILAAGDTRLAAHRAVLVERSPVFAAMFDHDTLEAGSGEVSIPDVEDPVLRQLLAFLYTLQVPELPGMALNLLAAAEKYGVSALKAACEQQVAAQLSVETAAAAAVLAVKHSCEDLRKTAIDFIKAHTYQVMASQGWADAIRIQPEDVAEVSRLLFNSPAESRSLADKEKGRRLIEAAKQGAVGELEALLAAGADVAATDGAMDTALHWAAAKGHVEAARRLVARGAPLEARNSVQATPLHYAAATGHVAVVRLLLAASAYHSARQFQGWTPLHLAAWYGKTEAAAALLEAGADRAARTNGKETPLDAARRNNQQQLVDLLQGR